MATSKRLTPVSNSRSHHLVAVLAGLVKAAHALQCGSKGGQGRPPPYRDEASSSVLHNPLPLSATARAPAGTGPRTPPTIAPLPRAPTQRESRACVKIPWWVPLPRAPPNRENQKNSEELPCPTLLPEFKCKKRDLGSLWRPKSTFPRDPGPSKISAKLSLPVTAFSVHVGSGGGKSKNKRRTPTSAREGVKTKDHKHIKSEDGSPPRVPARQRACV